MKYTKLCGFRNNFFLLFFMENLSMILIVSRYCRRPDSMHNNENELNLVCPIVDLGWFFTLDRVEKDLSPSQFVTRMVRKIITKILMFGKAVVKIPSLVGHGHLKNVYIFHYLILSYFLHFTIGLYPWPILRATPWPTPVEDHCGHILIVWGPHTPGPILIVQGPLWLWMYYVMKYSVYTWNKVIRWHAAWQIIFSGPPDTRGPPANGLLCLLVNPALDKVSGPNEEETHALGH